MQRAVADRLLALAADVDASREIRSVVECEITRLRPLAEHRSTLGDTITGAYRHSIAGDFARWLDRQELPRPTPALITPPGDPVGEPWRPTAPSPIPRGSAAISARSPRCIVNVSLLRRERVLHAPWQRLGKLIQSSKRRGQWHARRPSNGSAAREAHEHSLTPQIRPALPDRE